MPEEAIQTARQLSIPENGKNEAEKEKLNLS
jgi:hypothetical protein